jgi:anti-sigma regulatory factor (Ser/Thr protein kinase)
MDSTPFSSYRIDDRSYVSFVKREIHNLVVNFGFSSQRAGEVDIIVSELTSNLIKYAAVGELLYRTGIDEGGKFFEMFCLDGGPGITNISRMMQDGNSSSGTLGEGLGAIKRLSSVFQLYSRPGWGTVAYCKVNELAVPQVAKKKVADFGVVNVCSPGEMVSGDGYFVKQSREGLLVFMADGLGHGMNAWEAAQEAISALQQCREESPAEMLRYIHPLVKKTRGLVATIAVLNLSSAQWKLCGIGNISTRIYTGLQCKNYTPYNGIVGHNIPRTLNDSVVPVEKHQALVMHSDGLRTRWNLNELPALLKYNPSLISGVLFKDNARRNDDMTILAGKITI